MFSIVKGLGVIAVLLMLCTTVVVAQPAGGPGGHGDREGGPLGLPLEELNLSSEQQTAIDSIMDSYSTKLRTAHRAMSEAHEAVHDLISEGSDDESAIRLAATDAGTKMGDMAIIEAQVVAAVRAQLTADQLTQLDKAIAERKSHMPVD